MPELRWRRLESNLLTNSYPVTTSSPFVLVEKIEHLADGSVRLFPVTHHDPLVIPQAVWCQCDGPRRTQEDPTC